MIDVRCPSLEIWSGRLGPLAQLAADNSNLIRSVDPNMYLIGVGPDDGNRDPVTDVNRLAALSAEYQHDISSLKWSL